MKLGNLFWGKQKHGVKMEAAKEEQVNSKEKILILEEDDSKCDIAFHNVTKALEILNADLPVEVISDPFDIMEFGITEQPAFIVNGRILAKGKMLTTADLVQLLHSYL